MTRRNIERQNLMKRDRSRVTKINYLDRDSMGEKTGGEKDRDRNQKKVSGNIISKRVKERRGDKDGS